MNAPSASSIDRRRHRERFWVILVFVLITLFGLTEGWLFQFQSDLSPFGNLLLFALTNLNVMLLLLLTYLVLRNMVKLIFERKRNILGHKLRTRLVIAFVGLTLIPTIPLFWLATQFIFSSLDYWFSHRVEYSLDQSVALAKDYLEQEKKDFLLDLKLFRADLLHSYERLPAEPNQTRVAGMPLLNQYHLDGVFCFDSKGHLLWKIHPEAEPIVDPPWLWNAMANTLEQAQRVQTIVLSDKQEGLAVHIPLPVSQEVQEIEVHIVALRLLPSHITERLRAITSGYEDYLQLKLLHNPLKQSHFITFSIATLLAIFAAIWFGFFLAKNITVPIQALLSATQCIAEGDLNVQLEANRHDEIGMLITSFNKMVRDLREGREQLAGAYEALQQSHEELEDRRRYMEIVLRNIAAGVVSLDSSGRIMTMNKSAEVTFGLQAEQVKGHLYSEFLQPAHMEVVKSFMSNYRISRNPYLEQQIQVMIGNRPVVLLVKISVLKDDRDQFIGVVIFLDDLTDLEKAQRMAAWREVARRIAHEIKNPLTPIQLSAQRLRRKYPALLSDESSILEECTRTIIDQVDHMKHLVNEFSNFARLPRAQLDWCDLASIVEECLVLYRHNYPQVEFVLEKDEELPTLRLDKDQFKQVMLNLVDNALHALNEEPGTIGIRLFYDPILKIARLECSDTGHGLSPEDKLRMFEPYYSTRERGTGLGLAIVASIVADHNGFVRVRDNSPRGTVIIIELPGGRGCPT